MPEKNGDNMNKNMALVSGCLLLFSTQLLADRPAVSEQNTGPVLQASEAPAMEHETPATEVQSELEEAMAEDVMADETVAPAKPENNAPSPVQAKSTEQKQSRQQTGDVLELRPGETLPVHTLNFPRRGMSMESVKKELGEPLEISPTIGDPPITSWTYSDRTVYFEHSRVIHAVSNR
jgi:hypothetical protein